MENEKIIEVIDSQIINITQEIDRLNKIDDKKMVYLNKENKFEIMPTQKLKTEKQRILSDLIKNKFNLQRLASENTGMTLDEFNEEFK